jgi:hypothetical protein
MGPSDRHDRLRRWQAASLLAAAPMASLSATDAAAAPPLQAPPGQQRIAPAALVERLHQRVLSGQSATATLEHWCAEHGLAEQARVRAVRVHGQDKPAPADVLQALGATRHRLATAACSWSVAAACSPRPTTGTCRTISARP